MTKAFAIVVGWKSAKCPDEPDIRLSSTCRLLRRYSIADRIVF